jgi:pyridinium-3,5-biscarboxylic acid mononucleotide synthase
MDADRLRKLLEDVQAGNVAVDDALLSLRDLPFEDLEFAKLDHHRALRTGFAEVIYSPGKTIEHILAIADKLLCRGHKVLVTRATAEVSAALKNAHDGAIFHETARIVVIKNPEIDSPSQTLAGTILVVAAGTADLPVADEAAVTASEMGSPVERLYDVGVAGIHRLLDRKQSLFDASALVVVAGMEGALASVVGGLVSRPVIAVPTSVGYGASFQGLAALLAMLNSCATGVAVMNIDNGFGAGYYAHLINLR